MSFMKHKLRRSAVVVAVAVGAFQALSVVGATVASAVGTCSFSGGVFTVAAPAPDDNLFIYQDTNGGIHVATTNGGAFPVLGTATDIPTCSGVQGGVATTTAINVTGDSGPTTNNQTVVVYMNKFVSGAVAAPDASATNRANWSTINWTVNLGSNGAAGDSLSFWNSFATDAGLNFAGGANGLDLNNDGDLDVTMAGVENFSVDSASNDGTDGNIIDLNGTTITGGPVTLGSRVGQHPTAPLNAAVQTYASSLGATTTFNTLNGGAGNDVVVSGAGDDTIGPGLGSDNVTCGGNSAGFGVEIGDWLDYSITTTAINANLSINTVTQGTDLDSVLGCENVIGTSAADTLTGDGLENALQPGAGDDTVAGGVGVADIVDYSDASEGVTVDLTAGTATGGSGSDTLTGIEDVNGSDSADDIMGSASAAGNFLFGNGGNDTLNGGDPDNDLSGGADRFDGGSGIDTVSYEANTDPTTVALAGGVVNCPPDGITATPLCTTGNGVAGQGDLIVSNTIENAILGTGDDTFTGSLFNNTVWPNGGQNAMTGGGGGIDTVNYSMGYTAGVVVNLSGGGQSGGGQDAITGFTNAVGTAFNDTLIGTDVVLGTNGANLLVGGKGNDNISGNAGPDLVRAGAGNDRVRGGTGDDTLNGQGGKDNIRGAGGDDDIHGGKGKDFCNGGAGNDFIKACERPRHNGQGPNGPGLAARL